MFPKPIFPIFPEAADLPVSSLYKTKYPGLRMGKWRKSEVSVGIGNPGT